MNASRILQRKLPVVALAAATSSSWAWTAVYTAALSSPDTGNNLSATASFATYQVGSSWFLDVVLVNASSDVTDLRPADVLTGLYWTLPSGAALSPVSASLGGSQVWHNGAVVSGHPSNVGGEWAFASGLSHSGHSGVFGVSASGLGLFGPSDRFDTSQNLSGPANVGGLEYGILPALTSWPSSANTPVLKNPLVSNSVRFVFSTGSSELSFAPNKVWAQYGTSLSEPSFQLTGGRIDGAGVPVPEPVTMGLGAAAVGLAAWRRRRKTA
ncbi:MAG: hypothetical protein N2109_04940 [Fimbriimonadales bacterium]|nr:hypothetical protein [Fimbriimonadales bacterium]